MVKWEKGEVVYAVETENYIDEYTITDIDYCQCCPDPKTFKVEILRKPKRKPYNGLIYIHCYPGSGLDDRSVYRVIDGKIMGCWYHEFAGGPYIFDDMSDATLSRTLQIELYGSDAPSAKVTAYFVYNDRT